MKKPVIILLVVIAIIVIIGIVGVISLIVTLFMPKDVITAEEFKSVMLEENFEVTDSMDQATTNNIEEMYIATNPTNDYQIEFYDLISEDYAVTSFENIQYELEMAKESNMFESSVNLPNNSKYTLSGNNEYSVVSRIGDTIIFVSVYEENKAEVSEILEKLGY